MFHQHVAARRARAWCIPPAPLRFCIRRGCGRAHATIAGERNSWTSGRRERGPARLAIARLVDQNHARAQIQHGPQVVRRFRVAESEQKNVELAGHFAQQIEDPHRAAVRERKRKIGTDHRDAAAARRHRPAFDLLDLGRINGPILLPRHQPLRTKKDRSSGTPSETARKQWRSLKLSCGAPGAGCRPGSLWARRETPRGAAARYARIAHPVAPAQGRSDTREIAGEAAGKCERATRCEFFGLDQEMPAVRLQALDLGEHPLRQFGIAGGERDDDRFRIFTKQPENEFLKRRPHLMEFDGGGNARGVQFRVRLRSVVHHHLAGVFLRTADSRFVASAAGGDLRRIGHQKLHGFSIRSLDHQARRLAPRQSRRWKLPDTDAPRSCSSYQASGLGGAAPFGFILFRAASSAA